MNQSWSVGDVEVTCVTETMFEVPAGVLVRDFDAAVLADHLGVLQPAYLTDSMLLRIAIQTFAIRCGDHRLIVDTCFGNDHDLPYFSSLQTTHLESLAEAGFERSTVDAVVCTHLHMDHVGWNTMLVQGQWVPTFPNAEYLFGELEYQHWRRRDQADAGLHESIDPVIAAGLHHFVDADHQITPEVSLVPSPGHTPGHVSVRIESGGEVALITGDMVHHPAQIFCHEWASVPDFDPVASVATRRTMFPALADHDVLVLGTHFHNPTGGHIRRRDEGGWSWTPVAHDGAGR